MKRIIVFVVCLLMITSTAFAEIPDISNLTDEELVSLNEAIIEKLLDSGYLKEVTVPAGIYTVGKDIPAGSYLVKNTDKGSWPDDINIYTNGEVSSYGWDMHFTLSEGESAKVELKNGYVIELEKTCIFTRFVGLGF